MKPLVVVDVLQTNCNILQNWASTHGAAVRQRTVQQETTMAKHCNLPEFMYQRQCVSLDSPIVIDSVEHGVANTTETADQGQDGELHEEFGDEFNPTSDEETDEPADNE